MRLRYTTKARIHLKAIHTYLADRNPAAARRIAADIRKAADRLRDFPFIGRESEVTGTREWVVRETPYLVIYQFREAEEEILILGVFHGAQDWQSELN